MAAATDCAPVRVRLLTPEVVFWLMCSVAIQTASMTQGLSVAWGWFLLAGVATRLKPVTEEAFCLAREKLSLRFWRALWQVLCARFDARFGAQLLWKGLRLLAIDGTEADVPNVPKLVRFFTRPRTQRGESKAPQGRLVAVVSMLTGFCVDFVFISRRFSEHCALRHLIPNLRPNDLLVDDRGFFSYAAMHRIPLQGAHYLTRAQYSVRKYARIIRTFGPGDYEVEFRPSKKTRKDTPGLPEVLRCRLIHFQIPGFRPSILLTSLLDPVQYPAEELVALYHRRWRIETIYREWKHVLNITNLRAHTPAGIVKEMHAHLMLSNLVRYVMCEACEGTGKTPLELSFLKALTAFKTAICRMSVRGAPIAEIYSDLLDEIRGSPILQRPGRSYPRLGEKPKKPQTPPAAPCTATLLLLT